MAKLQSFLTQNRGREALVIFLGHYSRPEYVCGKTYPPWCEEIAGDQVDWQRTSDALAILWTLSDCTVVVWFVQKSKIHLLEFHADHPSRTTRNHKGASASASATRIFVSVFTKSTSYAWVERTFLCSLLWFSGMIYELYASNRSSFS